MKMIEVVPKKFILDVIHGSYVPLRADVTNPSRRSRRAAPSGQLSESPIPSPPPCTTSRAAAASREMPRSREAPRRHHHGGLRALIKKGFLPYSIA